MLDYVLSLRYNYAESIKRYYDYIISDLKENFSNSKFSHDDIEKFYKETFLLLEGIDFVPSWLKPNNKLDFLTNAFYRFTSAPKKVAQSKSSLFFKLKKEIIENNNIY